GGSQGELQLLHQISTFGHIDIAFLYAAWLCGQVGVLRAPSQSGLDGNAQKKTAAHTRTVGLLGEDTVKTTREDWDSWDTNNGGKEWE
ncbi:hypothetical protein L914_13731, partial [Phytophthora nicotianae]